MSLIAIYCRFKASLVSEIHRDISLYSFYASQNCSCLLASRNSLVHRVISVNNRLPGEPIGLRKCYLIHRVKVGRHSFMDSIAMVCNFWHIPQWVCLFLAAHVQERNTSQLPFEYLITLVNESGECYSIMYNPIISCSCRKFEANWEIPQRS